MTGEADRFWNQVVARAQRSSSDAQEECVSAEVPLSENDIDQIVEAAVSGELAIWDSAEIEEGEKPSVDTVFADECNSDDESRRKEIIEKLRSMETDHGQQEEPEIGDSGDGDA